MGVDSSTEESMDVEVLPSTSGYNAKSKEKTGKSDNLPWYVIVANKYLHSS